MGGLDEAQREKQQQATTLSTSDKPRVADLSSRSAAPQPHFLSLSLWRLSGSTAWTHDAWRWDGTSCLVYLIPIAGMDSTSSLLTCTTAA